MYNKQGKKTNNDNNCECENALKTAAWCIMFVVLLCIHSEALRILLCVLLFPLFPVGFVGVVSIIAHGGEGPEMGKLLHLLGIFYAGLVFMPVFMGIVGAFLQARQKAEKKRKKNE